MVPSKPRWDLAARRDLVSGGRKLSFAILSGLSLSNRFENGLILFIAPFSLGKLVIRFAVSLTVIEISAAALCRMPVRFEGAEVRCFRVVRVTEVRFAALSPRRDDGLWR